MIESISKFTAPPGRDTAPAGWDIWPKAIPARIPLLADRAPFDVRANTDDHDRRWRESLSRSLVQTGSPFSARKIRDVAKARELVDYLANCAQHIARVVQITFANPTLGNFSDPFLESLFILLTWRTKIPQAHRVLADLRLSFSSPNAILAPAAKADLNRIVSQGGFGPKRSTMIINLISRFKIAFPDGDLTSMENWSDEEAIEFLTSIPGLGYKSALCVLMYSLNRDRLPIDSHVRRVLRRTGLIDSVYQEKRPLEHREYQTTIEQFVPPSVRRQLHTGLLSIGQHYCKPQRPSCRMCPINNCCAYYRNKAITQAETLAFNHVDLFAGAGGFGRGFSSQGFRTIMAADADPKAILTYRFNHPSVPEVNVIQADLDSESPQAIKKRLKRWRSELSRGKVHVLTAGLPCQGFSKAGFRTRPELKYDALSDPRNHLYKVVIEWARAFRPLYIVIENVPAMRTAGPENSGILPSLSEGLKRFQYRVEYGIINVADFGVAQIRHRLILLAYHEYAPPVSLEELLKLKLPRLTLNSAISDLPPLCAGEGSWYSTYAKRALIGHRARAQNSEDLEIFHSIRPGERYIDFVERRHDLIQKRKATGVRAVYSTGSFPDKFHRLLSDQPSRTIVAHLQRDGNGFIHPTQDRSLTPREAARLQGFSDDFVFLGNQGAQFIQIGNAVPPPVASSIARLLLTKLKGQEIG